MVKSHRSLLFTVLHHGAYANEFQMVFRYWWICLHSMLKTPWIKEKPKQRGETLNNSHSLKILWSSRPIHTDEYEKALRKAKKSRSSLFQRSCYKKTEATLCLFFLFPRCRWVHTWPDLQNVLMSFLGEETKLKSNANILEKQSLTLHSNGFPIVFSPKSRLTLKTRAVKLFTSAHSTL